MGRQGNYIITAFLLLALGFAGYSFLLRIPFSKIKPEHTMDWCGTESFQVETVIGNIAAKGKMLFMSKCASCHNLFKDATGPSLAAAINNKQWSDRKKLYAWIRNPAKFMQTDSYTRRLKEQYIAMMIGFPDMTDSEIEAVVEYIHWAGKMQSMPVAMNE